MRPALRRAPREVLAGFTLLLVAALVTGIASGPYALGLGDILASLARGLGDAAEPADAIVNQIRLPRVLLGALVGAGLAGAGVAMQGLFRNPLADPGLIGVSSGAALGAVAVIVLGAGSMGSLFGRFTISASAFAGGLVTTLVTWQLARRHRSVATLLLAGIAVNAVAAAATGFLIFNANDLQLRDFTFWTLGSLGAADWSRVMLTAPLVLVPLVLLMRHGLALNALTLGDQEAASLGFRPRSLQRLLIVLVALCVGAAVAVAGVVGFVGLVVPHLLRMAFGPDHRLLLPGSALAGASLVVLADAVARTAVAPAELPLGVLTALLGGPFFLWLLLRDRAIEVR